MYIPEELFQNILWELKPSIGSHLRIRDDNSVLYQTLNSCLRAGKTLYRLAEPVLYHTVNTDDLFRVARHLAINPSIADQVRELSVNERDSHESVQVMDDTDDQQWPEYLHDRMSVHPSCLSKPNLHNSDRRGYSLPIATFGIIVCTNIHTLCLDGAWSAPQALTEMLLKECLALNRAHLHDPHVPLANLRESKNEGAATLCVSELNHEPGALHARGSYWFSQLLQLPRIESITVGSLPRYSWYAQTRSPGLKCLTSVYTEPPLLIFELEHILQACPMLEYLDVTWQSRYSFDLTSQWGSIGMALTQHGSNLHKLKLDHCMMHLSTVEQPRTFINLASLSHLRSLTLPVEASYLGRQVSTTMPLVTPFTLTRTSEHMLQGKVSTH